VSVNLKHGGKISYQDTLFAVKHKAALLMVQNNAIRNEVKICSRVIRFHFVNLNESIKVFLALTNVVQADHADVGLVPSFAESKGLQNHDLICRFSRNDTLKDLARRIVFVVVHSRLDSLRNEA